jgi:hypothetical protein
LAIRSPTRGVYQLFGKLLEILETARILSLSTHRIHIMDTDSTNRAIPSYTNPDARAMAIVGQPLRNSIFFLSLPFFSTGLSISVPGGVARGLDTNQFYDFLQDRQSGIITVPNNRWNAEAYYGTSPGKICTVNHGGIQPSWLY